MGWIYKLTCKATGLVYIGQTIQDVKKRWSQHKSPCSWKDKTTYLARAVKLYGWKLFDFEVVCKAPNDELDDLETRYIAEHDSFHNGLNSTPGGKQYSSMLVPEVKAKRMATMRIPDVRKRWLTAITAAQKNPEQKALLSKLCTERCKDPAHMQKRKEGMERYLATLTKEEQDWVTKRMRTPEATVKRVKALKATLASPIGKKNHADATKAGWKNPDTRAKRIAGMKANAAKRKAGITEKTCKLCGITKPLTDYYGRGLKCKPCTTALTVANRKAGIWKKPERRTVSALEQR